MKTASSGGKPLPKGDQSEVAGASVAQTAAPAQAFAPGIVENQSPAEPAVVAARPVPRAPRKTMDEMRLALEQLLERPYPATSMFYVLHVVARLGGRGSAGASLDQLAGCCAKVTDSLPARLATRVQMAVNSGFLEPAAAQGCYLPTPAGLRFMRETREARLRLWKVNPLVDLEEICAIADLEEAREEISAAHALQACARVKLQAPPATGPARRKSPRASMRKASFWAGLTAGTSQSSTCA